MRSEDEVLDGLHHDFSHPFVKSPISEERGIVITMKRGKHVGFLLIIQLEGFPTRCCGYKGEIYILIF
jgi:hypothetical protein